MTGRYKAYSDYKESGVDWIPNIPFSWKVTSLRHLISSVRNGSTETQLEKSEELVAISRIETISTGEINMDKTGFVNPKLIPESFKLNVGDLLLSHINSLPMVGNVAQVQKNHLIYHGMNLLRLIPKDSVSSRYLYWQLKSDYSRRAIESIAKPAINQASVSTESLKALQLLYPSIAEQQKIANFLDHETAKIDTLIAKQEKLIELLKEKRQAVISHAVTKGLNPDAPMKDSGVEWLGEVPEHWNILKFGITNKSAELGGNYNSGEGEEGLPLIKMGNLGRGDISLKKIEYLPVEDNFDKAHLLNCGDFLFNTRNSLDLVGKVSIWKNELPRALYNSNVLRISFEPTLVSSSQYMSYLLNSDLGLSQLRLIAKGTTSVAAIYYKELKSISFPLPTLKEQEEIVEYVEKNIEKLDELIKQSQKSIQLIKERKTALISAAVTGKIDVRDWQGEA
ncbi:restriction endonuclease subunit S [Vibrio sp. 10N.261.46.A3]|uniref:restriction endonuclease subunit S n=1 Tax=Vibrio sp. 10N.261.46.A3 TaxID=3229658 RepID=UPI0035546426